MDNQMINTRQVNVEAIKLPKYFPYLVAFCLLVWLGLFVDRVFLFQNPNTITKITAQFEIIINILTLIPSFKIYINSKEKSKKILLWFIIASISILLMDFFWYFIRYLSAYSLLHTKFVGTLLEFVPFYIWIVAIVIFLFQILNQYVLQKKYRTKIFFLFAIINTLIILLFLSSINPAVKVMSLETVLQIVTFIALIIVFDFVILCLMFAENIGLILFLFSIIGQISGYFFLIYRLLSQTYIYTYGELLWLLGLLFNLFGILKIQYGADYKIKNWLRKDNDIKSRLVFWCFSIAIIGFLLFFITAYSFSLISKQVFLGIPIFIMFYSAIIIVFSIYIGNYFEEPFKQIKNNIKNLMLKDKNIPLDKNFSIEEFVFLQDFILEAFRDKDESAEMVSQEQERFKNIVKQTLHDIQSPIMSLNIITTEASSNIPENTRVTLRQGINRISDIANNLIKEYQNKDGIEDNNGIMLVSLALLQVMREKRYEYNNAPVQLEIDIAPDSNFAVIQANQADFKRMISNLVNNAVEALKGNEDGLVTIKLTTTTDNITVSIKDNGYGMPKHIQDKFYQGISVTEGKAKGQGVGLVQIRKTIQAHGGNCVIHAIDGVSTEIVMTFPRIATPSYIASKVHVSPNDTIIVLDDDDSIHGAWDTKFENILKQYPTIRIKHFTQGIEAITHLNNLTQMERQNTLLLTDYELLDQRMNGLDVVAQTEMKRAILVTSWATNPKIQNLVIKSGITTIPKELSSAVTIIVTDNNADANSSVDTDSEITTNPHSEKVVDMVWLEDNKWFAESIITLRFKEKKVDVYYDPDTFMQNIGQYPKNSKIVLDTFYKTPEGKEYPQTGYTLAVELHNMGYTKLILFSGDIAMTHAVPDYLTVILKEDDGIDLLAQA